MVGLHKRRVFYISGYDPRGARHYYNLYKKESQKEKERGDLYRISKREKVHAYCSSWKIQKEGSHTNYHFLEWDDLIRKRWEKSWIDFIFDLFYIIKSYVLNGTIVHYARNSPTQMITAFYPVLYLLFALLFPYIIFNRVTESFSSVIGWPMAVGLGVFIGMSMMILLIYMAKKLAVFWLLRIYKFSSEYIELPNEDLKERIGVFVDYILKAINEIKKGSLDEIIIVSHSVGTILTVPILAEIRRRFPHEEAWWERFNVMTLGECIPVVSFHPKAWQYREEMKLALQGSPIIWMDFTTPIDGACFPLLDFYAASKVEVPEEKKPRYLSPRFHKLYTPKQYYKIKKNRYFTHFIYLMSTEIDGPYNFFRLTAGEKYFRDYIALFKGGKNEAIPSISYSE